jgi:hypothetical protein
MNAVEIEEAVSRLAEEPFDAESFPYAFLEAFGNKATTIQRLRSGNTNQSDIHGGVLQRSNIHILATKEGDLANALAALRSIPATSRQKCKFILATDGKTLEAENEQFRIKDAEAGKRYEEAIAIRETREQAERSRLQAELDRRTERLTRAARTEIKTEALRLGARDESLDELVELLGARVTLNDDLDVVVKDADSIAALVAGYLESKPHHRKTAGGQSMGTTGGVMTQTGGVASPNTVAEIQARVRRQGRATAQDIQDLREAQAS